MATDKKRILVAEDNRVMADVVRFNLQRAGFDVCVAGNGREAVELLGRDCFDLLITDYQMPEMGGEELTQCVRNDRRHSEIPVFLVSAKGFELDVDRLRDELGIVKVMCKPFSPKELVEAVRQVLEAVAV